MNQDDQYAEENCKLVGEWVADSCDYAMPCGWPDDTDPALWQYEHEASELIREALARAGLLVDQCLDLDIAGKPFLNIVTADEGDCVADAVWNCEKDPTGRHALFAATVQYLKEKKSDQEN